MSSSKELRIPSFRLVVAIAIAFLCLFATSPALPSTPDLPPDIRLDNCSPEEYRALLKAILTKDPHRIREATRVIRINRKIGVLIQQNKNFKLTTTLENASYIHRARNPKPGELNFVVSIVPLREINKVNKELATALGNLFKIYLMQEIRGNPLLARTLDALYSDFKTVEILLSADNPAIRTTLEQALNRANLRFAETLDEVKSAFSGLGGLASDPIAWHAAGIGRTRTQANQAARTAKSVYRPGSPLPLRTYPDDVLQGLEMRLKAFQQDASDLASNPSLREAGIMVPSGSDRTRLVPSVKAIELLRNVTPKEPTLDAYVQEVQRLFYNRFRVHITRLEAVALRDIFDTATLQSIDTLQRNRRIIDFGQGSNGVVSVDFVGQGARNVHATLEAMVKAKGSATQLAPLAERAEREATAEMMSRKLHFRRVAAEYAGSTRQVQMTGDDGVVFLKDSLKTTEEKLGFLKKLIWGKGRPGLERDYRTVFAPPGLEKQDLILKGENFIKKLRSELEGQIDHRELDHVSISVDFVINPTDRGIRLTLLVLNKDRSLAPRLQRNLDSLVRKLLSEDEDLAKEVVPGENIMIHFPGTQSLRD